MRKLLIALASAALLAGACSSARLYPVSGPAVTQAGSLAAKLTNVPAGHGKFTVVMPDGENVEGTYSTSNDSNWSIGKGGAAAETAAPEGALAIVASDWAAVFDPPPSVARMQRGEANASGAKGTKLIAEFAVNGGSGKALGVAKDNHGNLYRFEIEGLPSGGGVSQAAHPDPKPVKVGVPR